MGPDADVIVLDGRSLARRREPDIARRADSVRQARDRPPVLLLVAFADEQGTVPHVAGKVRTCERVGVTAATCIVPHDMRTSGAVQSMAQALAETSPDAVFVQIPAPGHIDTARLLDAIPPKLDVDIMTSAAADAYLRGEQDLPPVTVSGALALLDAHGIPLHGLSGAVVAEDSVYSRLIVEAFRRRAVSMPRPVAPASRAVGAADLVVAALGSPAALPSDALRSGCVALDFGYYNEGARGDIDTSAGVAHLRALMPVPGGVGPMTVSALIERVVAFAER